MEQVQNDSSQEYALAMQSIRPARTVFWTVVVAAIVAQLGSFMLVRFGNVLGEEGAAPALRKPSPANVSSAPAATGVVPASSPASGPSHRAHWYAPEGQSSAATWRVILLWLLPASKFAGLVASMLLSLAVLFAVKVALIGHRGGLAALISAFFWSLGLLAVMTPWQQVLPGGFASGALVNLGELLKWGTREQAQWLDRICYWGRFVAYPLLALVLAIIVQVKFARGARAVSQTPPSRLTERLDAGNP